MTSGVRQDADVNACVPTSLWHLGGLTWLQLLKNVMHNFGENDLFGSASGLAFNFLLGLFPLIVFLFGLFGLFASRSAQFEGQLLNLFADFLPPQAFLVLTSVMNEIAHNVTSGKLTFGAIVALWFASNGMSALMASLNDAYQTRERRPWYKVRAIGLALTFGISILLFSALFVVSIGEHSMYWASVHFGTNPLFMKIWKDFQWPAALLFVLLSFSIAYYFGPSLGKRCWRWATPGSVVGVLVWLAASAGFRIYLRFFNTYSQSYGSLAGLMILLVWLYGTGLAFLVGAEINAEIERTLLQETIAADSRGR